MPCYDTQAAEEHESNRKAAACLCGVLRAMTVEEIHSVMSRVGWARVGVEPRWLADWWARHEQKDREAA